MRRFEIGMTMLALLLAICFLCGVGRTAGLQAGPVVFQTLGADRQTLAGVALGMHVIPPSTTNKAQDWFAKSFTVDLLAVGSQLNAIQPNVGVSLSLLAPEGSIKFGATYLWGDIKKPAVYLGYSVNF